MAPYRYFPLDPSRKEIRVLTLHPGEFSTDIRISINKAWIEPDLLTRYEALSYVWGSTDNPSDISVKAKTIRSRKVSITQNLALALRYLRYKKTTRTLWVDALCINQTDLEERSNQVGMMGDIYRSADRVVVWLGLTSDNSTHILKVLSDVGSRIKSDLAATTLLQASDQTARQRADPTMDSPLSDQDFSDLDALLQRPWFSRLWVLQEVRLANEQTMVICGSDSISWETFKIAIIDTAMKPWDTSMPQERMERLNIRLSELIDVYSAAGTIMDFGTIIRRTGFCQCSDARDRIYAILTLLDVQDQKIHIIPDYTRSTAEVYRDVTAQFIEQQKSLDLLRYCEHRAGRSANFPTWVPDWNVRNAAKLLTNEGRADCYSDAIATFREGGVLNVKGVMVGSMSRIEEFYFTDRSNTSMIREIRRLVPPNVADSSRTHGQNLLDVFVRIICGNTFSDMFQPPATRRPSFEVSRKFVLALLSEKSSVVSIRQGSYAQRYLDYVELFCNGRSLVSTTEGHLGLAPKTVREGDLLCVLLGCKNPLVLRPATNHQYMVLGECYVHALQHGEAFLGPLPDTYRGLMVQNESDRLDYAAFRDERTGEVQYLDPRIEKEDGDLDGTKEIRFPNGEVSLRLTTNMLKRRGIELQDFDLI
ncbi:MAG: hypothetical protein Q9218_003006 [Villophora microphyllina]